MRLENANNTIETLMINNTMVNNSQEIAHKFNDYFSTVADTITNNTKTNNDGLKNDISYSSYLINNPNATCPNINWKHASTYEISNIIKSLKTTNSCGYDEIPVKIIKLSTPYIISRLTYICNKSLSTSVFPERLKYALIRPVHKKGDTHLITNYRPISLLTSFSKIFEKLIFTRLYKHLLTNRILAKGQYGFRNNSSTENAAYDVINEIIQVMNHKRSIGLFCDLEKAFDCVNHEILQKKLDFYGIKGKFLDLIQSFIQGRYQKIFINKNSACDDTSSEWTIIMHGSILGPLLFFVCVNDLPLLANDKLKIFLSADDTSAIVTCPNQAELKFALQKTLADIN